VDIAVQVDQLVKKFGDFAAVNEVSFQVRGGEIFGLLGPNGSGKSTTIRVLCGLLLPTSGTVIVHGLNVYHHAEQIRTRIGYMPQFFSLYGDLSARQNLEFYAAMYSVPPTTLRQRMSQVCERLELGPIMDRLASELSTGWRQRLALATSILHHPPLVFLDEPTSGVDPITRRMFWELIDDLAHDGTTVFVTTHVMDEAEHCTHLAMMHYGRLIAQGSPEQMRSQYAQNMVQVRTGRLWDALAVLQDSHAVVEAVVFGDAIHAECAAAVADPVQAVRKVLQAAGLAVESVTAIQPTMEDVFVSLARRFDNSRHVAVGGDSR